MDNIKQKLKDAGQMWFDIPLANDDYFITKLERAF